LRPSSGLRDGGSFILADNLTPDNVADHLDLLEEPAPPCYGASTVPRQLPL
jgi:hypothetical protein